MDREKTFVIDTNVFIHRPDCINSFRDSNIVIPLWVFEELDYLKKEEETGRGKSARAAIRYINNIAGKGNLSTGIKMDNGSILKVGLTHKEIPSDLSPKKADNKIISCAVELMEQGEDVFFVSKDINARIKSIALGVRAVDYEKHKVSISTLFEGLRGVEWSSSSMDELKEKTSISTDMNLNNNEFLLIKNSSDESQELLSKYREGNLHLISKSMESVVGVSPLNLRQRMAFDLLLDDSIPLVSLVGKAGTGKTLLALAAGLQKVVNEKEYVRLLVSRPVIPMGKDIGYLPGAKNQKMAHWMQPLFDNLEHIIDASHQQNIKSVDQLLNNKTIEVEALTYIRGRSLPKQFIIIDEAQNLTPHEVKTIVSRAGEGTKVILTGDPYQIDSPYLDSDSNGLTYLVEAFKGQVLAGHVTLAHSERSPLAEIAAELL